MMPQSPFISPEELSTGGATLLDTRWYLDGRDGYRSYLAGHIPGSVFADLEAVATGPIEPGGGRHPLPPVTSFLEAVARLGVRYDRPVVLIDDQLGSIAARLWWMLDACGFDARLLDGGVQAAGPGLCTEECTLPAAEQAPAIGGWPALGTGAVRDRTDLDLLDARAAERYHGLVEPVDRAPGHIPGARSIPWTSLFSSGRIKGPAELRPLLSTRDGRQAVAYCGSGVTACMVVAAGRAAGIEVELYGPSYSGWSSDPENPICTCG